MDTATWQNLMDRLVADYQPTYQLATVPGPSNDPLGLEHPDRGHLATIMNQAVDALVGRGTDRDHLLDTVATQAGPDFSRADVDAILTGTQRCPDVALLQAFCAALSIDPRTALDAALRGGCTNYGASTATPPGY